MSAHQSAYHISADNRMTITAGTSNGHAYRVENGVPVSGTTVTVPAGSVRYVGPFGSGHDYVVVSESGLLSVSIAGVDNDVYEDGSITGLAGNLTTIPDGKDMVLRTNGQALVFDSLTVNGTYQVDGELRVQSWPA